MKKVIIPWFLMVLCSCPLGFGVKASFDEGSSETEDENPLGKRQAEDPQIPLAKRAVSVQEHGQDDVSLPDLPDELWIHVMSYPGVAKALYGVSKKFYDLAHDEKLSHVLYHRISSKESLDNLESFLPSVEIKSSCVWTSLGDLLKVMFRSFFVCTFSPSTKDASLKKVFDFIWFSQPDPSLTGGFHQFKSHHFCRFL